MACSFCAVRWPSSPATTKTESQLTVVKRRDMMRSSCWKGTKKALPGKPVRVSMLHFRLAVREVFFLRTASCRSKLSSQGAIQRSQRNEVVRAISPPNDDKGVEQVRSTVATLLERYSQQRFGQIVPTILLVGVFVENYGDEHSDSPRRVFVRAVRDRLFDNRFQPDPIGRTETSNDTYAAGE
jgi:hypothetical protein